MAKTTKKKAERATNPEQAQSQQDIPTINVSDIGAAAQYIDVAFRRGAFQASEAAEVGMLFNKLANFVTVYNQRLEEEKKAQEAAEGDE